MPSQTMALNLQIPYEGLKEFHTTLSSIKDTLNDLVQPLKDIRDCLLAAIEPLSAPIAGRLRRSNRGRQPIELFVAKNDCKDNKS